MFLAALTVDIDTDKHWQMNPFMLTFLRKYIKIN